MNAELPQLGDRLLVALFNGAYQGFLVTAAVWLCLKLLPRTNAATRYAVWGLALLTVLALPVMHFALEQRSSSPDWLLANQAQGSNGILPASPLARSNSAKINPLVVEDSQDMAFPPSAEIAQGKMVPKEQLYDSSTSRAGGEADAAPLVEAPDPASEQPFLPFDSAEALVLGFPGEPPALLSNPTEEAGDSGATAVGDSSIVIAKVARVQPAELESQFLGKETGVAPSVTMTLPKAEAPPLLRPPTRVVPFNLPRYAASTILIALALFALARIAALARQILILREVKTASEPAPESISKRFESICLSPRKKRPAELLVSLEANSPMVVGFLRPAILIPKHLVESLEPAQLDPILRHELAHVRRFDDWANLAQQGVKALFGFHPAVIWICRRLSLEREIACDDYVLHSGQKARDYAMFLTEFASQRNCRNWSAAPAAWSRKTQLKERVNMILKTNRSISPRLGFARLGILSTTAAALAIAMLQLAPRLSAASQPAPPNPPVASIQSADSAVIVGPSGQTLVVGAPQVGNYPVVALTAPDAPLPPTAFAAAPATPSPRIASSGPRSKDSRRAPDAENSDAAPGAAEPPVPPTAPAPDEAPPAPMPPYNKFYGSASSGSPDSSLEDRLRRVEQMLESLLHQKPYPVVVPKPIPHPEGQADMKAFKFDWKMSHPDITWEKQAKQFEHEAQLFSKKAELDAKRAAELSAAGKSSKALAGSSDRLSAAREKLEQQRRALESQRTALEKQLEDIENQCERIEQQQEKLQEEREKQEELQRENHNTSDNDNQDESDELATH
jgi:beta-lactamase regulating signal transducer with metallopeptidase domain